jgi:hypothetical protein
MERPQVEQEMTMMKELEMTRTRRMTPTRRRICWLTT